MARDGTPTRERLLDAAQHLFARRGVDAVPIREINEQAGQRNASALHYHFGSRQGLLVAIVERHQPAIDAERAVLLARAGDDPHSVLAAVLAPLTDRLRSADGRDYLRIVPQLLGPGHQRDDLPRPPALVEGLDRLDRHLGPLPARTRSERLRSMLLATTTLLADRATRLEGDGPVPLGHDAFAGELVAMATGLVLAAGRQGAADAVSPRRSGRPRRSATRRPRAAADEQAPQAISSDSSTTGDSPWSMGSGGRRT